MPNFLPSFGMGKGILSQNAFLGGHNCLMVNNDHYISTRGNVMRLRLLVTSTREDDRMVGPKMQTGVQEVYLGVLSGWIPLRQGKEVSLYSTLKLSFWIVPRWSERSDLNIPASNRPWKQGIQKEKKTWGKTPPFNQSNSQRGLTAGGCLLATLPVAGVIHSKSQIWRTYHSPHYKWSLL